MRSGLKAKTNQFEHAQDGICVIPPVIAYVHVTEARLLGGPPVFVKRMSFLPEAPPLPNSVPVSFYC